MSEEWYRWEAQTVVISSKVSGCWQQEAVVKVAHCWELEERYVINLYAVSLFYSLNDVGYVRIAGSWFARAKELLALGYRSHDIARLLNEEGFTSVTKQQVEARLGINHTNASSTEMNWTKLLADAGIPEPPGYRETVALCLAATAAKKAAGQAKPKGKRKSTTTNP